MISAKPRKIPMVPSVTMNGLMRSDVVIKPLANPQAMPIRTPTIIAQGDAMLLHGHGAEQPRQRQNRADG